MMQVKSLVSGVGILALAAAVGLAGDPYRGHYGGPCDKGEAESQAGMSGDGGKGVSDPVYLATGDFQHVQTDLVILGRGMDFEIKRFFRSKSGFWGRLSTNPYPGWRGAIASNPIDNPQFGMNWDFNYNMRIDVSGNSENATDPQPDGTGMISAAFNRNGSLTVFMGNGRFERFETDCDVASEGPIPAEQCIYTNELYDKEVRYTHPALPVVMRDADNTVYTFLPSWDYDEVAQVHTQYEYAGRLASIEDRNGNMISFTYETSANGEERIAYAIDTLGHQIDFDYHDDAASPINNPEMGALIWRIVDHAGRAVEYDYTDTASYPSDTKLSSATLPSIVAASDFPLWYTAAGAVINHGRFPNGRAWQYEYKEAVNGMFSDGLLSKITDPNGVVILENEYNDGTTAEIRANARVIRQVYAGDAYNYIATTDEGSTDFWYGYSQQWMQDYYVWVNDRRGAITRFKYAGNDDSPTDVPGQPDQPRHLQLLEKVEFTGFVTNPDQQVWAECDVNGDPVLWKYMDANGVEQTLASGPVDENGQPGEMIVTSFVPDRHWNIGGITSPGGGSSGQTYQNHDYPPLPGTSPDPMHIKTVTSRTVTSSDSSDSITEYWRYGTGLSGGCGCGSEGFETAYQDGKGNVRLKEYDASGNLLTVWSGLPVGTSLETIPPVNEAAAVESYAYNQWGQVITHTHAEKIILDAQGSEVAHNRVDQYEYYNNTSDPANHGRLHKKRVDVNGFDLTTTYEYDLIGNVIKTISPGGDVTEYLYNQASQLVRAQHFDSVQNLFSEKMYFYDANGNMVVKEELNLDDDQNLVANNKWFTTVHVYDDLGFITEISREKNAIAGFFNSYAGAGLWASSQAASANYVTQRWTYDAHRNVLSFEDGEAVSGAQASNITTNEYDARDLRIKTVKGVGGTSPLTTTFVYDEDGQLQNQTVNPDDPLKLQDTSYVYDGFNRVHSMLDPMGNEIEYAYDDNHNLVEAWICGSVEEDTDSPGDEGVTLVKMELAYDTLDRKVLSETHLYDYAYSGSSNPTCGSVPGGATVQTAVYVYNEDFSLRVMTVPAGEGQLKITNHYYDTAGRLGLAMDGDGNIKRYAYDGDSNLLTISQEDVLSDQAGSIVEQFVVTNEYDALDRLVAVIDGVSNRTDMFYDSRSNLVERVDAKGNTKQFTFDGLGRQVSEASIMTDTGDGLGTQLAGADGTIVRQAVYDDSNRLIAEIDDNGSQTDYAYDGANRLVSITVPDGEQYTVQYDHNGNVATYTDARGVVTTQTFDLNNRLVQRQINNSVLADAATVPYITQEDFTYDGLGRVRTAINDFTKVVREYNSRSMVTREIQNVDAPTFAAFEDRIVGYGFDDANNTTQVSYPSGREIYRRFDRLNRLDGIFNDAAMVADPITEFVYLGSRVQRRNHGNSTQTVYAYNGFVGASNDPNDFGFGRVASISTINTTSGIEFDAFDFTWDRNQNRTAYKDTGSDMKNRRERALGYDSSNRLVSTDIDFPDPLTDFPSPTNAGVTNYTLDGVHNRTAVTGFENNGAPLGQYMQGGNQALNNQYSLTPREEGGEWTYVYDASGNMVLKAQSSIADWTGDYAITIFDFYAFLDAFNAGDPSADINEDGLVTIFDFYAFLDVFNVHNGTSLEHNHYSYDFRNQLVHVSKELGTGVLSAVTNTYDPMARRLVESVDMTGNGVTDTERQFVYGCASLWEVVEQLDLLNSSNLLSTHVFGLGIDDEVSYRIEDLATPEDFWTHRDDLGSVTSLTDNNGAVVERYEYGDYGDVRIFDATGSALSASAYNIHHLYTGRTVIPGTGLMDYRYRVYSPETGRFAQRDPLGYIDGMNLYAYVGSSPMAYIDPMGLNRYHDDWQMPSNWPELQDEGIGDAPGFDDDKWWVIGINDDGSRTRYNVDNGPPGFVPPPPPPPAVNCPPKKKRPQPWWRSKPYGIFHPGGRPAVSPEWTPYGCDKFCRKRYAGNSKNLMTCYLICMAAGTDDSYMYALMTGTTTLSELYEFLKDN